MPAGKLQISFCITNPLQSSTSLTLNVCPAPTTVTGLSAPVPIPTWSGFAGQYSGTFSTLGYDYYSINSLTSTGTLQACNVLDLEQVPNIAFLRLTDTSQSVPSQMTMVFPSGVPTSMVNILARVQLNQPQNALVFNAYSARDTINYIQYTNPSSSTFTAGRNWARIHVELIDTNGNYIDFNGANHTFLLRVLVWPAPS